MLTAGTLKLAVVLLTLPLFRFANANAIISNGVVTIGLRDAGSLVTAGTVKSSGGQLGVGLRLNAGQYEALSTGCACEGWGVSWGSGATTTSLFAHSGWFGLSAGLIIDPLQSDNSSAVSVVTDPTRAVSVIHAFQPSSSGNQFCYEAAVTIKNLSPAGISGVRYRRVADWDIEPTPYFEFLTVEYPQAKPGKLVSSVNFGFGSPDPRSADGSNSGFSNSQFKRSGPRDNSVLFEFDFGTLAAGAQVTFKLFYGAAPTEELARQALTDVQAEVFSLGQSATKDPSNEYLAAASQSANIRGSPATFLLGFSGVSGASSNPTTPVTGPAAAPDCTGAAATVPFLWPVSDNLNTTGIKGVVHPDGTAFRIIITSVAQNEPITGGVAANGNPQLFDAKINAPPSTVKLRASRTSSTTPRIYYVTFKAQGTAGQSCSGIVLVTVPVDVTTTQLQQVFNSLTPP